MILNIWKKNINVIVIKPQFFTIAPPVMRLGPLPRYCILAQPTCSAYLTNMSTQDKKPLKISSESPTDESDCSTVYSPDEVPSMTYVPRNGSLLGDTATLFEGSSVGSSGLRPVGKLRKPRQSSMSSPAFKVSLKQILFNENRAALDLAIHDTMDLLRELVEENKVRPIFFPAENGDAENLILNSPQAHLALVRQKLVDTKTLQKTVEKRPLDLLLAPLDFKVLKLGLLMGHNKDIITSLDKNTILTLLDQKLSLQIKYLMNLKDRVDDTSSKVFVTGDLNAGKSTFCNALLRRKVLPEDQQPCTSVFCEVIDAKSENNSVEEVHAIPIGSEYNQRDESSYERHPLHKLEDLVYQCDNYILFKVYVLDYRSAEQSLLGNGVIDIHLIDAPGLNMDSYQTTQVFSRQEEIDLVVFVVNAENHFTLSAKEFIAAAAAEKRYVFIVVNRFDNIRDKDKCKAKILAQVKNLSPDTHKNSSDFVHFVSSTAALDIHGGNNYPGDDSDGDMPEFGDPNLDYLDAALRRFILEKRSISKLLPAKNYLINLLGDLRSLSEVNHKIYVHELDRMNGILKNSVGPKLDRMVQQWLNVSDKLHRMIEKTATLVYNETRGEILDTLESFGSEQVVPYYGIKYAYEYAKETQRRMIDTIVSSVHMSEERAKIATEAAVNDIIELGKSTLGEEFLTDKSFKPELMFTRKRDFIKKSLDDLIDFMDFFDPSFESLMLWLGIPKELASHVADQVSFLKPKTVMSVIPKSISSIRDSVSQQVTLQTVYASTKVLTTTALLGKVYSFSTYMKPSVFKHAAVPIILGVGGFTVFYLTSDIPNAFPRNQARKLKCRVMNMDYAHVNSDRISKECRLVLNYPSRQVMNNFQTSLDKKSVKKQNLEKEMVNAEISCKYFKTMLEKTNARARFVEEIDLESNSVE